MGFSPEEVRLRWRKRIETWYRHPDQLLIAGRENLEQVHSITMSLITFLSDAVSSNAFAGETFDRELIDPVGNI